MKEGEEGGVKGVKGWWIGAGYGGRRWWWWWRFVQEMGGFLWKWEWGGYFVGVGIGLSG